MLINTLTDESRALKQENASLISEKDAMQRELVSASEYILQLEEKVHRVNITSLELLKTLRDRELEIEQLNEYYGKEIYVLK